MTVLPRIFYKYFWDVYPSKIKVQEYPIFVAQRLLDWGHADELRFVMKYCGGTRIINEILRKRRGLRMRKAQFWAEVLGISFDKVESLKPEYHTTWKY